MPNHPEERLVGSIVSEGNVAVIHTVIGPVHVNGEVILASKRKTWRPLSIFTYPSDNIFHDLSRNYLGLLLSSFHEAFESQTYVEFTGLIHVSATTETYGGVSFSRIQLISNQPTYMSAIERKAHRILASDATAQLAARREINEQFREFSKNWTVQAQLLPETNLVAYRFIYDSSGRRITIYPLNGLSGAPSEYPDKVKTTTELLGLAAVLSQAAIVVAGDMDVILHSYPLSKLFIDVLDKSFSLNNVRINAHDLEEWDYINPKADEEFRRATKI